MNKCRNGFVNEQDYLNTVCMDRRPPPPKPPVPPCKKDYVEYSCCRDGNCVKVKTDKCGDTSVCIDLNFKRPTPPPPCPCSCECERHNGCHFPFGDIKY